MFRPALVLASAPLLLAGCGIDQATDAPAKTTDPAPLVELAPGLPPGQMTGDAPGGPPRNPADLQRRVYSRFAAMELMFGGQRSIIHRPNHRLPFELDESRPLQFAAVPGPQPDTAPLWRLDRVQLIGTLHDPAGRAYDLKPGDTWTMRDGYRPAVHPVGSEPVAPAPTPEAKPAPLPTRPLDAFELEALAALRSGGTLPARVEGDRLRMLGAVRVVSQSCVECHKVPEGTLLGAFSYELRKVGEGKVPPPPKEPEAVLP